MARRFCVGGNWKLNGDKNSIKGICSILSAGPLDPNTEVVIGCTSTHIEYTRSLLPAAIGVAGQVSASSMLLRDDMSEFINLNSIFGLHRTATKSQVVLSLVKYRRRN